MLNDIYGGNESDVSEDRPRHTRRPVPTLGGAEEALCAEFVKAYFTRTRPTMTHVYGEMLWAFHRENERRIQASFPLLCAPSFSSFRRRVTALPVSLMRAARHGTRRA